MSGALLDSLQLGATAFVIALTGAMAPGPLLTVTIEHTVTRGRGPAMLLMVGHALLEAVLLVGLAFGLRSVLLLPAVTTGLSLVGGGSLMYLGVTMLRDAVRGRLRLDLEAQGEDRSGAGPILRGAAVSLANPYWGIWWATIGLTLASRAIRIGPGAVGAFFVGHEAADFLWYGLVIWAVSSGRRFLSDSAYRWLIGACATLLALLGARYALAGLGVWPL